MASLENAIDDVVIDLEIIDVEKLPRKVREDIKECNLETNNYVKVMLEEAYNSIWVNFLVGFGFEWNQEVLLYFKNMD